MSEIKEISSTEMLERMREADPEAFDLLGDEITDDEKVLAWFTAEACHAIAQETGMSPTEVFNEMFDGREYRLKVTIDSTGTEDIEFLFDAEDEPEEGTE